MIANTLHDVTRLLGVEEFDKKYTILAEGSPARYIGIMLSGSAHIIQMDYYG